MSGDYAENPQTEFMNLGQIVSSRNWIDLGAEVTIDASEIIAVHIAPSSRHVAYTVGPAHPTIARTSAARSMPKSRIPIRPPRAVAVTARGLLIPSYVTKETALARIRGEPAAVTPTQSGPLNEYTIDMLRVLEGRLRQATRERAWGAHTDLGDDALEILADIAGHIHELAEEGA